MSGARMLVTAALASWLFASWPQGPASSAEPADDAFSLLREQTVTGVSKRPLPLSETPSSVTVIPAGEIRAMGYHSLGEALRWVRGVFVTYDRNYTYVGVRGLQRPGDYNNKVLLSIDGHTLNGSVFGDALFGPELGLDLEEVERIEVVRGPGSTLYGSYAALAVVNVVTRRPRSEPGVSFDVRAGGEREWRGHATVASARPGWPEWHASISWLQSRGADLFFPEFASPVHSSGRAVGLDGERGYSFFGTAEWGIARLALKFNDREKTVPTASYGTRFGDDRTRTWDGHDYAELSATRRVGAALELSSRAYWDGSRYRGQYIYVFEPDPTPVVNQDRGDGDLIGAEFRTHWAVAPRHALTLGVEGQRAVRAHLENYDASPYHLYYDQRPEGILVATCLQDEFRVGHTMVFTAGARLDNDSRYEAVVSPRADLVWTLAQGTRLKLLGGSAFRAPSAYEVEPLTGDPGTGAARLRPERVATVEGTLEHETGPFLTSLTAYGSQVRDLIDLVAVDSAGQVRYENRARVRARGLEGEVRVVRGAATRARLALAWQRSLDGGTGAELSNSPRWNAHLLAVHAPPAGRYSVGLGARYLSSRLTLSGRRTAAALVCDARDARRIAPGITIGLEASNLFDARYGDPGSREHVQDQIIQDRRALFLTLSLPSSEPR